MARQADSTTLQHLGYGFDKAGNVSAITNINLGGVTQYGYDILDRMTAATAAGYRLVVIC